MKLVLKMLNVISKKYFLIVSTGVLFFLYFMLYLFLTGNYLFLIIGIIEIMIALSSIYLLLSITKK